MSSVAEKLGPGSCKSSVVELPIVLAYVCLVFNIISPGAGTWWSAWCCCGEKFRCDTLCHGYGQSILAVIVIGWLWSIMHGIWLVKVAKH